MNEKQIWDFLYGRFKNPFGVAGLMGNLYAESALNPKNLQNSYEKALRMTDDSYTSAVDNGTYANFVRDSAGYGLAQWTYWSRKEQLLIFAKETKASIGDLAMQLAFLVKELACYTTVMKTLLESKSVREASDAVLTKYEKPKNQSEGNKMKRALLGQRYYDQFTGTASAETGGKEGANVSYNPMKLIEVALGEVGYLEKASNADLNDKTANAGDKNYTKYGRDLKELNFYNGNKNGVAWCDVFVDWCFVQAFGMEGALKLTYQPTKAANNCGAGCKYSRNYYKKNGRLFDDPKPGDQVFFYPKDGIGGTVIQHTGLVYDVDGTYVYTIEGNTNGANGVVANGGGVCKKKYKLAHDRLAGFGRPVWDTDAPISDIPIMDDAFQTPVVPEKWDKTVTIACQNGGKVNVRKGNDSKYGRVGQFTNGVQLEWIATAANGWHACVYGNQIVWVSGEYATVA